MTDKQLRKLSRRDLLEILLEQSREVSELRRELEEAQAQLESRKIVISESGSIAEAALKLNKVFEAAQEAANHYLDNMSIPPEMRNTVSLDAKFSADDILRKAELERQTMLENTRRECEAMLNQARLECQQMRSETEDSCRHMQYEALRRDLLEEGKI